MKNDMLHSNFKAYIRGTENNIILVRILCMEEANEKRKSNWIYRAWIKGGFLQVLLLGKDGSPISGP